MLTFLVCFAFIFGLNCIRFCKPQEFSIVGNLLDNTEGDIIAGFGDFNADKHIDIFVITNFGQQVDLLVAAGEYGKFSGRTTLVRNVTSSGSEETSGFIGGIMLADFNGDGQMDILVNRNLSYSDGTARQIKVEIYWGDGSKVSENPFSLNDSLKDEPVLFDYNADMLPDLLTQDFNGSTVVWLAQLGMHNFSKEYNIFPAWLNLSVPHSSAFTQFVEGDKKGDKKFVGEDNTDLILTTAGNGFTVYANNNYTNEVLNYTSGRSGDTVGQSSFADFNQDGTIDHVIPTCVVEDGICKKSKIEVYIYNDTWCDMLDLGNELKFIWTDHMQLKSNVKLSVLTTLVVGDYNRDGFPDILVILNSESGSKPYLLKNVPGTNPECPKFGRMFEASAVVQQDVGHVYLAAFFDLYEDGNLDIILTVKTNSSDAKPRSVFLKNNVALDTCFMKVTVTSGICEPNRKLQVANLALKNLKDQPDGVTISTLLICQAIQDLPYGVNTPGPTVRYKTTNTNGDTQESCACQLTQSAHFALQLPFVMFGLGQTPNFVDTVSIAIPSGRDKEMREKTWTQIIPNSQLLVNPYPNDLPPSWKMQLFVMPSKQIYITAAVLGGTCIVLVFIVAVLLWRERREDKMERKQESHKFHFDAM